MPTNKAALPVKAPQWKISDWKPDLRELFAGLTKAAGHIVVTVCGKDGVSDLVNDVVDIATALKGEPDPGKLAWLLIRRALLRAVLELFSEAQGLLTADARAKLEASGVLPSTTPSAASAHMDLAIELSEVAIDGTFIRNPAQLRLVEQVRVPFEQWLTWLGLTPAQVRGVSQRLPAYFSYAIHQEWRSRPGDYRPLAEALETPFSQAAERQAAWDAYSAWLQRRVHTSMFGEPFGLFQVYIPLRAYYERRKALGAQLEELADKTKDQVELKPVVVDLQTEITMWINAGDQNDAVRLISGGPGSGKSSFSQMLAAQLSQDASHRTIYIPLHQLDPRADLIESIADSLIQSGVLAFNPLAEFKEDRFILILDGLDELAMQGRATAEVAGQFLDDVERVVQRYNQVRLRLQVLVCGREIAMQNQSHRFRKPKQILHCLPFFINATAQTHYADTHSLLGVDQRKQWWAKYGDVSGFMYSGLPTALNRDDLEDITSQPLLNYLLALSLVRGKLDFTQKVNLNQIYDDLLHAVYERGYAGSPHPAVRGLSFQQFRRVLEEIALAAWHGSGRTTTLSAIEDRCKSAKLDRSIPLFTEGAKHGIAQLLTAFYFRQHGQNRDGEPTFEFTHKSFGEYLTALRIMRALRKILYEQEQNQKDADEGWDEREAIKHWLEICAPTAIDQYLLRALLSECELLYRTDPDMVARLQASVISLIRHILSESIAIESFPSALRLRYNQMSTIARNAGEALLAIHRACAEQTRQVVRGALSDNPTIFGAWLYSLQEQREGPLNALALSCLCYLDLSGTCLDIHDLWSANLEHSLFSNSRLQMANLGAANLNGADLSNANLQRAYLVRTKLVGANLSRANLAQASMRDVRLTEANLENADLRYANIEGGEFDGASLRGVDFRMAKLDNAFFRRADITQVNFADSDFGQLRIGLKHNELVEVSRAVFLREMASVPPPSVNPAVLPIEDSPSRHQPRLNRRKRS